MPSLLFVIIVHFCVCVYAGLVSLLSDREKVGERRFGSNYGFHQRVFCVFAENACFVLVNGYICEEQTVLTRQDQLS